jgi:hypothetical protein
MTAALAPDTPATVFRKRGMGYELIAESAGTELRVSRLKRSSAEMTAEVVVTTRYPGVKVFGDNVLHVSRLNLSSVRARQTFAKYLHDRTPGMNKEVDWVGLIDELCMLVITEEMRGEPIQQVGQTPIPPEEDVRFAVEPLVPVNVASIIYGPGGSGKSVLALALALSVQAGREIVPGMPPTMRGNVLYLDWETDAPVVNARIQSIAAGAGFDPPKIAYRRCRRPLADDAEELAGFIAQRHIAYVVIDSTGMAMGTAGDYGDANEGTLRLFEAIRHLGKVTVHLVDHVAKQEMRQGKKVVGRLPYGSIYKINLARSAWEIRAGASDDLGSRVSLYHTKSNDSRLKEPIGLQIMWADRRITFREADVTEADQPLEDDEPTSERTIKQQVHDLLRGGTHLKGTDIAAYIGMADKYDSVKKSIQRDKAIEKDSEGLFYLVEDGPRMAVLKGGKDEGDK